MVLRRSSFYSKAVQPKPREQAQLSSEYSVKARKARRNMPAESDEDCDRQCSFYSFALEFHSVVIVIAFNKAEATCHGCCVLTNTRALMLRIAIGNTSAPAIAK
jgi:hypothetical protein